MGAQLWTVASGRAAESDAAEQVPFLTGVTTSPVLWLLGKVQSGKTSIVRAFTGSDEATIGNGFTPATRTARLFAFPPEAPVLRFLDTRGLG